jgi:DNA polymerase-1
LIYGESDNSLLIKLSNFIEPEYKLYQIKEFLKPIIEKSQEINNLVKEQGYLIIPTNSIIKPNKYFAGYNNYIQAYASEIMVDKLFEIKKLLNSRKTEFIFQVHDSMVFDLHPDELDLINKITNILSNYENMKFNLSINIGLNYKDLKIL